MLVSDKAAAKHLDGDDADIFFAFYLFTVPTPSAAVGMHDDLVHSESPSEGESGSDSDSD